MPRISQLPSLAAADNSDEIAIVDTSASVTKKITRGDLLKAPLPANSVTTAAIQDGAVTADKIDFTTFTVIEAKNTTTFTSSSTTPVVITGATVTLTIPQGVSKIKLTGIVRTTNSTNFLTTNVGIHKNGASIASGAARNISGGASQYQDTIPLLALDSVSSGQSVTYDLRIFCTAETGAMTVGQGWASLLVEVAG